MNTHGRKRKPGAFRSAACISMTVGLLLCSSCSTPPSADNGLVGLVYHAAARKDSGNMVKRGNATSMHQAQHPLAADDPNIADSATSEPLTEMPSYRVSPGDVLAVSYFAQPSGEVQEYLIDSQDVLTISLAGQDTQTADVTVRPDGCISFFLVGELRVRGQTVAQVRANLAQRLARVMPGAEVTVILKDGNALAKEFLNTLKSNTDMGSTRAIQVRQDGTVTFPLVGEVRAMGKTLSDLSREVESQYDRVFKGGIALALNLNSSSDGNIAVLGEVRNPGRYTINNPISPFFALAMAGGALDTAKKSQVVVVKRQPDGRVGWHVVNLDLDSGRPLGPEIALAPQDMLLVPKTGIASINLFVDQYIRRTLPLSVGYGSGNWQYYVSPK
jgi:polysaccharide export outer membrane protein